MVSDDDVALSAKDDKFVKNLNEYIVKDKQYLLELKQYQRYELQPLVKRTRAAILRAHERIAGRERQLKHMMIVIRRRLAYEKIKAVRKQINGK